MSEVNGSHRDRSEVNPGRPRAAVYVWKAPAPLSL